MSEPSYLNPIVHFCRNMAEQHRMGRTFPSRSHTHAFLCASVCQRRSADKKRSNYFEGSLVQILKRCCFRVPVRATFRKHNVHLLWFLRAQSCVVGSSIWLLFQDWSKSVNYSYSDLVGLNRHQEDLHGGLKSFRIYSILFSTELQARWIFFFFLPTPGLYLAQDPPILEWSGFLKS